MEEITQNELTKLKDELAEIVEIGENGEMLDSMIQLLAMPDEDFIILAPGIMQSYQQSLNNPNDKIILAQALNASGAKSEDLIESFDEIEKKINTLAISVAKRDFLKELLSSIVNTIMDTEGIAKKMIAVPIELCHPNAKIPQYAHITDSGMDVYALDEVIVHPGETVLVPTGIKVALPPGYELQVRPKSGRAYKTKLRIANTPGTIDQGYRDEIKIIIESTEPKIKDASFYYDDEGIVHITSLEFGSDQVIGKGEKFCQLVIAEVPKAAFYPVDTVQGIGEDRGGGFGSTGVK
jgi:dUTP pyrophosphatase